MNSNQRSQGNNQSDNGGNEKSVSSSRGGTVEKDNINQSQQSGTLGVDSQQSGSLGGGQQQSQTGSMQSGSQRGGGQGQSQQGSQIGQQSTDRTGSQTGTGNQQQGMPAQRESNDAAGGYPRSPGTKHLSADQDMDDDTGLSNRGNRQSADEIDNGSKQEKQSNVGRRSDMTPD
jgi:hypothetical protein